MKHLHRIIFEQTTNEIAEEIVEYLVESGIPTIMPIGGSTKSLALVYVKPHLTDKICEAWLLLRFSQTMFNHEVDSDVETPDDLANEFIVTHLKHLLNEKTHN